MPMLCLYGVDVKAESSSESGKADGDGELSGAKNEGDA